MATFEQLVDYKQDNLYPFIGTRSFEKLSQSGDVTDTAKTEVYSFLKNFFPSANFNWDDTTNTFGIDSAGKDDEGDFISSKYPVGILITPSSGAVQDRNSSIDIAFKFAKEKEQQAATDHITITKVPQSWFADEATSARTAATADYATGVVAGPNIAGTGNRFLYIDKDRNFVAMPAGARASVFGIDADGAPTRYELTTGEDGTVSLGGGGAITVGAADVAGTAYRIIGVDSATVPTNGDSLKLTTAVYSSGSPYFKGMNLYQTSDESLKTFTQDLDINLDELTKIKKGLFYWNNDSSKKLELGVTAQSVEQVFPEIVDNTEGVKCVSYSKLGVVALAAIDKLNEKIKELESEIADLKSQLAK